MRFFCVKNTRKNIDHVIHVMSTYTLAQHSDTATTTYAQTATALYTKGNNHGWTNQAIC